MKIVHKNHPALYTISEEVDKNDPDINHLITCLWFLLEAHNGIGLAANQLGVTKRVIVINVNGFKQEFINPVITKRYGGRKNSREGCLSFPNVHKLVVRDGQIVVRGFDCNWKPIKRKLKNLTAFCIQHEIDHLNGITIGG